MAYHKPHASSHAFFWCFALLTNYINILVEFKSFVMNNKGFGNLFCNSQKSYHTFRDLPTRIIEAIDHSSNSTMAFAFTKNPRRKIYVNAIVEFEEWSIASIIRVVRSRGGVKTLLWIIRINYQKLCDLMRQITKELNWPTVQACVSHCLRLAKVKLIGHPHIFLVLFLCTNACIYIHQHLGLLVSFDFIYFYFILFYFIFLRNLYSIFV